MRIIVVSDTHGRYNRLEKLIQMHNETDVFIHLGDGEYDFETVKALYPEKTMLFVSGNCDTFSLKPNSDIINVGGKKILFTHGATYNVKYNDKKLISQAISINADIVLYGHTHIPVNNYINNKLYVMNPGSLGKPSSGIYGTYGIIDVIDGNVLTNIAELK